MCSYSHMHTKNHMIPVVKKQTSHFLSKKLIVHVENVQKEQTIDSARTIALADSP